MRFLEKNLEDIIWESDNEKLREKGFDISGVKKRQLKIGNYGIADIVTFKKTYRPWGSILTVTVYELKKDKAGISAFLQAVRYCKGISSYFKENKPNLNFELNIVLCSKEIDKNSDYIFLSELINSDECYSLNSLSNYSFNYTLDGIEFKEEKGYDIINKGF